MSSGGYWVKSLRHDANTNEQYQLYCGGRNTGSLASVAEVVAAEIMCRPQRVNPNSACQLRLWLAYVALAAHPMIACCMSSWIAEKWDSSLCMCAHVHSIMRVCTCMYPCLPVCLPASTCLLAGLSMHTQLLCRHARTHACMHVCMYVCMYVCMRMCVYVGVGVGLGVRVCVSGQVYVKVDVCVGLCLQMH